MSLLTLTQVDGVTVFVASNQVVAIRQDAENPTTRCYVTMQGIETPVYVAMFWATLVVTVDAELSNQYIELLTTGEQVSLSLDYVYQLRPDPSSPLSRTMVVMGAQGTPFMVSALASVLAAAMQPGMGRQSPVYSFSYTPGVLIVLNCDSVTPNEFRGFVVGRTVFVAGLVSVDPTASGAITWDLSLYIPSNFTSGADCTGSAVTTSSSIIGRVQAETVADRAQVTMGNNAATLFNVSVQFSYILL